MRTDAGTVSWGELVMDVINTTNERWLVAVVEGNNKVVVHSRS